MSRDRPEPRSHQYPPFYEKLIPIALALIGLAILVMLVIILSVALGLLPAS